MCDTEQEILNNDSIINAFRLLNKHASLHAHIPIVSVSNSKFYRKYPLSYLSSDW